MAMQERRRQQGRQQEEEEADMEAGGPMSIKKLEVSLQNCLQLNLLIIFYMYVLGRLKYQTTLISTQDLDPLSLQLPH